MRKQVILIMEGNQYPFGQADQSSGNKSKIQSRILVRKKHETSSLLQRNKILDKIHLIKGISNTHLMKIQTVLQQQNSVHILYEYVPNCLVKKIKTLSDHIIHKIRDQLWELGNILGDMGVIVEWDKKNIGINDKMETKYYLDLQTIKIEQNKASKNLIQRQHFQSIMALFPQFSENKQLNNSNLQKQLYLPIGEKKEISPNSNTLLHARQANSIDSKYDIQNLKRQVAGQMMTQNTAAKLADSFKTPDRIVQRNKNMEKYNIRSENKINLEKMKDKQKLMQIEKKKQIEKQKEKQRQRQKERQKERQRQRQRQQKIPMRNSRHNWKQMEQNSQFLQDFINVLDDKSQNAKSKYLSQEQQGQNRHRQSQIQKNNSNEEQQIVWMSGPQKQERDRQEDVFYGSYQGNKSADEEIVWMDYRDFTDIRERAKAAIKRSSNALQVFRNILSKYK